MDQVLFHFFNQLAGLSPFTDSLAIFLSETLGWFLVVVVLWQFIVAVERDARLRPFALIIFSAIGAWIVALAVKYFWYYPRPFVALPEVTRLISQARDSAWPSAHAAFFSALALAYWSVGRPLRRWFGAAVLLISLARVVVGVHWPGDILLGWAIGLAVHRLINRWLRL